MLILILLKPSWDILDGIIAFQYSIEILHETWCAWIAKADCWCFNILLKSSAKFGMPICSSGELRVSIFYWNLPTQVWHLKLIRWGLKTFQYSIEIFVYDRVLGRYSYLDGQMFQYSIEIFYSWGSGVRRLSCVSGCFNILLKSSVSFVY